MLSLLVLKTEKLEDLRQFYETLGIRFTEEQHRNGPVHYAAQVADLVFELYPLPENAVADKTTRLGFRVDNLVDVLRALETTGTAIVSKPQATDWGLRALVRDPDGRSLELYEGPMA